MPEVLAMTWPDYSVGWAHGGTDEIAAYVGAECHWEVGRRGQPLKLARGRDGLRQVVSVVGATEYFACGRSGGGTARLGWGLPC